jgi:hypothetical protein
LIDCFDGLVVSWTIGTRPDAELVNTMLDAGIETVASNAADCWPAAEAMPVGRRISVTKIGFDALTIASSRAESWSQLAGGRKVTFRAGGKPRASWARKVKGLFVASIEGIGRKRPSSRLAFAGKTVRRLRRRKPQLHVI